MSDKRRLEGLGRCELTFDEPKLRKVDVTIYGSGFVLVQMKTKSGSMRQIASIRLSEVLSEAIEQYGE